MKTLTVTSYSATLDFADLATAATWSILSTHTHACNLLRKEDRALVALVSEAHGNGPFHLVIPGARFAAIAQRARVAWDDQEVQVGSWTINLTQAKPWNPLLIPLHNAHTIHHLFRDLSSYRTRSLLYSGASALVTRAQAAITALQSGIVEQKHNLVEQGAKSLAGLGPGLTPAGDDFLIGFMAALHVHPAQEDQAAILCRQIGEVASQYTTQLSSAWLHQAACGHFGEQWHQLIGAANGENQVVFRQVADAIAATGATSGVDALCGLLAGMACARESPRLGTGVSTSDKNAGSHFNRS